jgi:hypothetical protein
MSDNLILTELQMIETFGRNIAGRVRMLTTTGEGIFDEFEFNGRSYLASYEYYSKSYYILKASTTEPAAKQPGGTIITVRTKQRQPKKTQYRRLETVNA